MPNLNELWNCVKGILPTQELCFCNLLKKHHEGFYTEKKKEFSGGTENFIFGSEKDAGRR